MIEVQYVLIGSHFITGEWGIVETIEGDADDADDARVRAFLMVGVSSGPVSRCDVFVKDGELLATTHPELISA